MDDIENYVRVHKKYELPEQRDRRLGNTATLVTIGFGLILLGLTELYDWRIEKIKKQKEEQEKSFLEERLTPDFGDRIILDKK